MPEKPCGARLGLKPSATELTAVEEFYSRYARIIEAEFIEPQDEPDEETETFGPGNEEIRRLYTLMVAFDVECQAYNQVTETVISELRVYHHPLERRIELEEELERLMQAADRRAGLYNLAHDFLALQVVRTFPEEGINPNTDRLRFFAGWLMSKSGSGEDVLEDSEAGVPLIIYTQRRQN